MSAPPLALIFRSFAHIGLLSFGGPAAQISMMHEELVVRRGWLSEQQFLGALSFCMLLPGPEAMQLCTYAGWRLRGVLGGLIAGLLFVLPGAAVILALGLGYATYGDLPMVQAVFLGVKAAVVVIVLQALLKLAKRALKGRASWVLAGLGFVAMFFLSVPFPFIIAAAALWGAWSTRGAIAEPETADGMVSARQTATTALFWGALWAAPVLFVWATGAGFLTDLALFFSKLAVVTFGGAYAVLAYMTETVVATKGWLSTAEMIDALGLAETTPGPLILVTEFVGLLAGYAQGGVGTAVLAACLTLWVTFIPCFLWIFTGAPYIEHILARPRLKGALAGISAAVVGVILNLSVWFALHVLFGRVTMSALGPRPEISSFSPRDAIYVAVAGVLLLGLRLPMVPVLALMAVLAGLVHVLI
ncbi:chromate transporter, chromate ion transporter (CHR) family [Roseovarius mucosus DSM 17069]|uniref:Chromate transporter, chromate ion transporter (CHR) family n=1 Tax=Roseovarius mucosus DSM 17069 TaxID=1288298 RepID=A0A0A0HIC1_9RHOB|nr:chromate efflux transporter [Roseovarius mucosus]KGM86429.1 chromate transporter, chromate ion transporter (CHR) family [Roseovarius mucosus DSM 17069]